MIDNEFNHQNSPAYISAQVKAMEEAHHSQGKIAAQMSTQHPYTAMPGVGTPGSAASEAHQASIHR